MLMKLLLRVGLAVLIAATAGVSSAKLPSSTPAQAEAAAAKKAQAAAQAEKDKQAMVASMDAIALRWRSAAAAKGWQVNAPTPVAAPVAAIAMPATGAAPGRDEKSGVAPATSGGR